MSKLAKLYLAAAAAQVSNEDIEVTASANPGSNDTPAADAQPEGEATLTATRPEDAVPAETPAEPVVEQSETAAETVAATEDATVDESTGDVELYPQDATIDTIDDGDSDAADVSKARAYVDGIVQARDMQAVDGELSTATGSLTGIREVLEVMNDAGGVSQEALPYIQIALEAHSQRLGLASILLGVSFEAYENASDRFQVSLEHLDQIIEHVQNARTVISNEDRVPAADAGEILALDTDEVVRAQCDAECENESEAFDTAVDTLEGLGTVRSLVEQQNAAGGLSLEGLAAASLALEAFTSPIGLPEIELAETMDTMGPKDRVIARVENIDIAMEGVGSWLGDKLKRVWQTALRGFGTLYPKFTLMSARLGSLIETAQKTTGKVPAGTKVTPQTVYLDDDDKAPTDPVKFLSEYAKVAEIMIGKFHDRANKDFKFNIEMVKALSKVSDATEFEKALASIANGFKDPRNMLTEAQLNLHVPGSRRHFKNKKAVYAGTNAAAKKLDAFATQHIPTRIMDRLVEIHGEDYVEMPALQPGEVVKVTQSLKAAIESISTMRVFVEAASANLSLNAVYGLPAALVKIARRVVVFGDKFSGQAKSQFKAEVDALRRAVDMSNYMRFHVSYDAALTAHTVASGFIKYAKLSLKKAGADGASTESLTGISMEGADPKKLKSGVKVRFSHGHGKVAKVFTAPFMFAKKHHPASKDDPRYLVKADKGGHQSVHKASALTIV